MPMDLPVIQDCQTIRLTQGYSTLVDEASLLELSRYRWCADVRPGGVYAITGTGGLMRRMHRLLCGAAGKQRADHWNGDTLDNRIANLRVCSPAQNNTNTRKISHRKGMEPVSRFKGVSRNCTATRWVARIVVAGRDTHIGAFDSEEEAARAYDRAAVQHFGEFACLNFPEGGQRAAT